MIGSKSFLINEFKLALVNLLRLPSFSSTVIVTLAATIAALAVVLNINYLVLTKPLPYPDADKLIVTDQSETINGETQYGFQILSAQFHLYQDQTYIEQMALLRHIDGKLKDVAEQPFIDGIQVSPEYFSLLGMPMLLGRHFSEKEGINDQQRVVVLSSKVWREHFNSDPEIIGQQTRLGNALYEIVGVAAADFEAPEVFGNFSVDAWVSFHQEISRTSHWGSITSGINGIAKLKQGISLEQASASLGPQINELYLGIEGVAPDTSIGARFIPLKDKIIRDSDEMAFILLAGVITLLFIAVTNITNLLFSRAVQKQRLMAIQAALGAQPKHLFWGMFAESLILVIAAWIIGLVLAGWLIVWLQSDLQYLFPRMQNLALDPVTIVVSGVISVLIALVMAYLSVKQVNYNKLMDALQASGKGTGAQISSKTRNVLVVLQVSLATVILLGAAAILSPIQQRLSQSVGFQSDKVYQLHVDTGGVDEGIFEYSLQLKQALTGLTQVNDASRTLATPLAMNWENYLFDADNKMIGIVSTGMFDSNTFSVMGHELLEGRTFSAIEQADALPQEMIISASLAQRLFGKESAIGQTLQAAQNEPMAVVGVVSDIYVPDRGYDYAVERYYIPYPGSRLSFTLKLNTQVSKAEMLKLVQSVNPNFSVSHFYSLDSRLAARLHQSKLVGLLTLSLVSLALCLAAAGIYGVLSYSVQMRRYELAIRLSLGAHTHKLINMVVKQSMKAVMIGILVGCLLAIFTHLVSSQIWVYQLRADTLAFILALPIIGMIATVACYWPVKKLISADPIKALRND